MCLINVKMLPYTSACYGVRQKCWWCLFSVFLHLRRHLKVLCLTVAIRWILTLINKSSVLCGCTHLCDFERIQACLHRYTTIDHAGIFYTCSDMAESLRTTLAQAKNETWQPTMGDASHRVTWLNLFITKHMDCASLPRQTHCTFQWDCWHDRISSSHTILEAVFTLWGHSPVQHFVGALTHATSPID